jgi:hypothetical protein
MDGMKPFPEHDIPEDARSLREALVDHSNDRLTSETNESTDSKVTGEVDDRLEALGYK